MKTVCTLVFVLMLVLVVYLMHYRAWRIAFVKAAPRNSMTHAELIDGDRRWWIEKRTRNDYRREWHDVTVEKYTATDTNDLDLVKGWGFRALLEMEDPAHRDAWCLENFHKVWDHEKPFSGESFFDWIDYGSGKQVETTEYTRRALNKRSYHLMNVTEIEGSVVDFNVFSVEGNEDRTVVHLSFAITGEPVPTGTYLNVWNLDQRVHLLKEDHIDAPENSTSILYYKQGHASVTHGKPVKFAGEVGVGKNGQLLWSNPSSGHYRPALSQNLRFFRWMRDTHGIPFSAVEWRQEEHHGMYAYNATEWQSLFV